MQSDAFTFFEPSKVQQSIPQQFTAYQSTPSFAHESPSIDSVDPSLTMHVAPSLQTVENLRQLAPKSDSFHHADSSEYMPLSSSLHSQRLPAQSPGIPSEARNPFVDATALSSSVTERNDDANTTSQIEKGIRKPAPVKQPQDPMELCGYETPYGMLHLSELTPIYREVSWSDLENSARPSYPTYAYENTQSDPPRRRKRQDASSNTKLTDSNLYDNHSQESAAAKQGKKKLASGSMNRSRYLTRSKRFLADRRSTFSDGIQASSEAIANPVRRNCHPGRRPTIEQTPEVQHRNLCRRERYRENLAPKKRAEYDRNAMIAKSMIPL